MFEQKQNAYQQQKGVFTGHKREQPKKAAKGRWYRDIGYGIETPAKAMEGTYIDKKCPFTGDVLIRGFLLTGKVVSKKMERTIVVRRDYLHYIRKYNRYEKRHKNVSAHLSPAFDHVEIGDVVTIGECRPLSKTVRFNVVKISSQKKKSAFSKF
ncbi:MAG: 40S ribosomal protein S11 [Amphiamblys sp. WSBS2006]|nr:MAG: 40S ribosomal protein S11 [Amphiamblys sp. WSBS2006]